MIYGRYADLRDAAWRIFLNFSITPLPVNTLSVAKVCNNIPASAKWRAERMAVLYKRNKFFTSPLERMVYAQFEGSIREYKQREGV